MGKSKTRLFVYAALLCTMLFLPDVRVANASVASPAEDLGQTALAEPERTIETVDSEQPDTYDSIGEAADSLETAVPLDEDHSFDASFDGVEVSHDSLSLGESATIVPRISGRDASSVKYNYGWQRNGSWTPGEWGSNRNSGGDYVSDDSWVFTPSRPGTYTLFVDAVSPDESLLGTKTVKVTVVEDWALDSVSLNDREIDLGESVEVSLSISGASSSYARFNYGWVYEDAWKEWSSTIVETGSSTASTTWTFTPKRVGYYTVFVDAIRSDGTKETISRRVDVSSEWTALDLSVPDDALLDNGAVGWDKSIPLKVKFSEGSNTTGLTFNFGWRFGNDWSLWYSQVKDAGGASSNSSWSFSPRATGTYHLFVDVIGTDGTSITLAKDVVVELPYVFDGVTLSDTSVFSGSSVDVSPRLLGDSSGVTYNYGWQLNGSWADGDWDSTMKDGSSATSDSSWTFTPKREGTYSIFVDVFGPDGSKQTKEVVLAVRRGWQSPANLTVSLVSPQKVGTKLTFSAAATGERAQRVRYNYGWSRDGWTEWSSTLKDGNGGVLTAGEYTSETSFTFTPKHSGDYTLFVDLYDVDTGEVVTLEKSFRIDKSWSLKGLDLSRPNPLRPGATVSWTAKVSGDTTGLKYNFIWQRDNWKEWNSTLKMGDGKEWSSNSSATYKIGGSGRYTFYVEVEDAYGEREIAEVSGVRGFSTSDAIGRVISAANGEMNPKQTGYKYEDAIRAAGGTLCNGRHGWWCVAYIRWCFDKADQLDVYGTTGINADPEYLANEFKSLGSYNGAKGLPGVKRGDIVFFYWSPWRQPQNISHGGIVVGVTSTTVTVAEGNTFGGGVRTNVYNRNNEHLRGYARPAY